MCSAKLDDFDEWGDINKLKEEVEIQKAKVESLQSEQKLHKNSYSVSDLYGKTRLDRSDSGIDRQSLLMDNSREQGFDSSNNVVLQECSANSIKKIIEITSLIRTIEHQLNIANNYNDSDSIKTYSSTCSMPKCIHEVPEQNQSNDSWIQKQLIFSSIEQERLNKQLAHLNNQLFRIENLKIPFLLNGISNDTLKKKIADYYKLKSVLAELATNSSSSSVALISVVKQLEPLAYIVEQYFILSHELNSIHRQINVLIEKKMSMQEKRTQLSKLIQLSNKQRSKIDHFPQSVSWNHSTQFDINSVTALHSDYGKYILPKTPLEENDSQINSIHPDENEFWKNVRWPSFNGDGIAEENPPSFEAYMTDIIKNGNSEHNRKICHEYVNNDVIPAREKTKIKFQKIDLTLSSFPLESIIIIQVTGFKLCHPLRRGRQYRARIQQLNEEGSDWHTICVKDAKNRITISPHILLPIKWSFQYPNLSLLFEVQMFERGLASHTSRFIFNIVPQSSVQNISVPMHILQAPEVNSDKVAEYNSTYMDLHASNSLKLQPKASIFDDPISEKLISGLHLTKNVISNRENPPIHYSNIRRSQTYSHDHQYCGNFECCSSIDFVSEPVQQISHRLISSKSNPLHDVRNFEGGTKSSNESGCASSNSSFKRQSPFRQPIRLKKHSSIREENYIQQVSDFQYNDQLIKDLWYLVFDLYLALNSCSSHDERLLEFAYFKKRCPSNLLKLYEYFVETIFDSDNKC